MIFCDRCDKEAVISTMSYFNMEIICQDCDRKERAHPKFKEALEVESAAVRAGDMNFPGIGKPEDL